MKDGLVGFIIIVFALALLLFISLTIGTAMAILFGVTNAGLFDKILIGLALLFLFNVASGGK